MSTFTLYIGSNNKTRQLEVGKIKATLARRHDGFTLAFGEGFWRGVGEKTAIVTVASDTELVLETIKELKHKLGQDAVAYQEAPEMRFA